VRRSYRTRWENGANCESDAVDPEIFFEHENAADEDRIADPLIVAAALAECSTCRVIERCFREAVYTRSLGIRAGTTASERGVRYRPRVAIVA
jgi:hypothetical protein